MDTLHLMLKVLFLDFYGRILVNDFKILEIERKNYWILDVDKVQLLNILII